MVELLWEDSLPQMVGQSMPRELKGEDRIQWAKAKKAAADRIRLLFPPDEE